MSSKPYIFCFFFFFCKCKFRLCTLTTHDSLHTCLAVWKRFLTALPVCRLAVILLNIVNMFFLPTSSSSPSHSSFIYFSLFFSHLLNSPDIRCLMPFFFCLFGFFLHWHINKSNWNEKVRLQVYSKYISFVIVILIGLLPHFYATYIKCLNARGFLEDISSFFRDFKGSKILKEAVGIQRADLVSVYEVIVYKNIRGICSILIV